jgi:hypothetical protein
LAALFLSSLFAGQAPAQTSKLSDGANKEYNVPVWIDDHTKLGHFVRSGLAGTDIKLGNHLQYGKNCEIRPLPLVSISLPPKHGVVCTRIETSPMIGLAFSSDPYRCSTHTAPHLRVYYRSFADYAGSDSFRYDVDYTNGNRLINDVDVTIERGPFAPSATQTPASEDGASTSGPVPACPDLLS